MFTRRTATVTMSAPDAACACAITACDEYLPVPTMSRDVKVRPAMVNGVSVMSRPLNSAATHEIDDLDAVAVADERRRERGAPDDHEVVLHRDAPRVDVEPFEKFLHRQRLLEIVGIPVERNAHGRGSENCTLGGMAPGAPTATRFNRREALDRFRRARRRTRALFDLLHPAPHVHKPIALRNPIVFYEGHLPAFPGNTLIKKGLGRPGVDERLETIFARGIDPEQEAAAVARGNPAWPDQDTVRVYADAADAPLEDAIANADVARDDHPPLPAAHAVVAILEHEEMHQETLAYMWHRVRYEWKRKPDHYVTLPPRLRNGARGSHVFVPAGTVTVGTPGEEPFAWDNERPSRRVEVAAFEIDTLNVTNADFMQFVEAGGYRDPRHWRPG